MSSVSLTLDIVVGESAVSSLGKAFNSLEQATTKAAKALKKLDIGGSAPPSQKVPVVGAVATKQQAAGDAMAKQLQSIRHEAELLKTSFKSIFSPDTAKQLGSTVRWSDVVADLSERYPRLTAGIKTSWRGFIRMRQAAQSFNDSVKRVQNIYKEVTSVIEPFTTAKKNATKVMDLFRWSTIKSNAGLAVQKARTIGMAVVQRTLATGTKLLTAMQWAWNLAMSANPIGLVIAGVVALGAAAYLIYKNWEPIKEFFSTVWEGIKSLFSIGVAFISNMFSNMFSNLPALWEGVKAIFKTGFDFITKIFNASPIGLIIKGAKTVASWFSGKDDETEDSDTEGRKSVGFFQKAKDAARAALVGSTVAGAAVSPVAAAGQPPVMPPPSANQATVSSSINAPITIHARPGMNEQAIAEQVRTELERAQDRAGAAQRGALYDHG